METTIKIKMIIALVALFLGAPVSLFAAAQISNVWVALSVMGFSTLLILSVFTHCFKATLDICYGEWTV